MAEFVPKICVLGLGYVGLPLAVTLARKHKITGLVNPENPNEGYIVVAKLGLIYQVSKSDNVRYVHEGEVCRLMGPHARVIRTYYESRNLYNFVQR